MLHRRSTQRVALGPRRRPTAPISARRRGHRAQSAARVHTATRPRRDRIDKTPKTTSPRRNPSPTPCARRTRRAASRPRASRRRPRSLRGRKTRARASSIIHSFHRVSSRERRASRARAREARATDRSTDRGRRGTRRRRTVSARGGAMGALCRGQTHSRAEAQKGAARRGHGDATRRTRSHGRGFARGRGGKTRGTGRDGGRDARAREESDGARAMVTRDARVDAL